MTILLYDISCRCFYNKRKVILQITDYSIIVLFSILGSSLLISSFDLIYLYLSIELQSYVNEAVWVKRSTYPILSIYFYRCLYPSRFGLEPRVNDEVTFTKIFFFFVCLDRG